MCRPNAIDTGSLKFVSNEVMTPSRIIPFRMTFTSPRTERV
jgi:hypothetical protein